MTEQTYAIAAVAFMVVILLPRLNPIYLFIRFTQEHEKKEDFKDIVHEDKQKHGNRSEY